MDASASEDESYAPATELPSSDQGSSESGAAADEGRTDASGVECAADIECGGTTDCLHAECVGGSCKRVPLPRDTPCNGGVCDGLGVCVECTSDGHCATAECVQARCIDGACLSAPSLPHSPCGAAEDLVCNAGGVCVGCVTPEDCGEAPRCNEYVCTSEGECAIEPLPLGARVGESFEEDCRSRQCDGEGNTLLIVDDTRCDDGLYCNGRETCLDDGTCAPSEANPCDGQDVGPDCDDSCDEDTDACVAADARGTSCSAGLCDGEGACSECVADIDCSGEAPYCNEGECVGCIEAADCDPVDCWEVSCVDSSCAREPADTATPCGQAGDMLCDGEGTCVGCATADDCGEAPQCSEYACSASGECILEPLAAGELGSEPPVGDCRLRQCDGEGNVLLVADDARCDDGLFCNGQELCQGDGSCALTNTNPCAGHDSGPACSDSCDEEADACLGPDVRGVGCPGGACDGEGVCVACLTDEDCTGQAPYCSAEGSCVQCLAASHCAPASGVCSLAQICNSEGTCEDRFVAEGTSCGSSVSSTCTAPDQCDGNGKCLPRHAASSTACDDADPCTAASQCDGVGACVGTAPTCSGPGEVCTPTGNCVCDVGYRSCGEGCIPEGDCCDSSECGDNAACVNSQCTCEAGYEACVTTGGCIANNRCCGDDDCNPGQICASAGGFCSCPDNGFGQGVLVANSVSSCEQGQYRHVRSHPCSANDGSGYDYNTCNTSTCTWTTTESTCCTGPSGPPCPWL